MWKEVKRLSEQERKNHLQNSHYQKVDYNLLNFFQKINMFNAFLPQHYSIISNKKHQIIFVIDNISYDIYSDEDLSKPTLFEMWEILYKKYNENIK
jgi:hypothetical protein